MKIASSNVQSASAYQSATLTSATENLDVYKNGQLQEQYQYEKLEANVKSGGSLFLQDQNTEKLSPALLRLKNEGALSVRLAAMEQVKIRSLQYLFLYLMRGAKTLRLWNVFENQGEMTAQRVAAVDTSGYVYTRQEERYESERMEFQMKGKAVTEDGRSINFEVSVRMSREVYESFGFAETKGQTQRVNLTDPLVVQLKGVPSLTQNKFSFDIDMDGKPDQISFAGPGSGFLALDKNGDGVINDGGELFGPAKGNGFLELAMYDSDGNGWIDENDPVFDCLRVWCKDENGQNQLFALGEVGIGAIYLGYSATEFAMKDDANVLQGQMRYSGAFLYEDGGAGTIHQIDLVN